jgi:geranylgeranyl diphosphate synthase type II
VISELEKYTIYLNEKLSDYQFPSTPENLYDPLTYFIKLGGKRIRPLLTLMATECFGSPKEKAIHAALAVELFHNFSLIHDDIMDNAPLRRAQATVHEKWNSNIAILSGDVLLVKAYQELAQQNSEHIPLLLESFNKMAVEVCEGQQMDMDFETRFDVSIDEYIEMIRLKTSVLLGTALEMGAIISNTSEKNKELIYQFGVNIGIAFQIQDDILDLYGEPDKFGKKVGGDILANKKTILLLKAFEVASSIKSNRVTELIENDSTTEKIELAKKIFEDLNVINFAKSKMNQYQDVAFECLNAINLASEKKNPLKQLALFLVSRDV